MKRVRRVAVTAIVAAFIVGVPLATAVPVALAATLKVCPSCTYKTIQNALSHSSSGDVIQVGAGTFHGPVTVVTSVKIMGSGAHTTIIKGGGPVVAIGTYLGSSQPTVTISGVTITGGFNTETKPGQGGGGIEVYPSTGFKPGGRVTIERSIITHNAQEATFCGSGCTFSQSLAGGILNFGHMKLTNSTVDHNSAAANPGLNPGFFLSAGGGVATNVGSLTMDHDAVMANRVGSSNGQDAQVQAGGVLANGALTMNNSKISGNSILAHSSGTTHVSQGHGGGLLLTSTSSMIIRNSAITNNSVKATGGNQVSSSSGGIQLGYDQGDPSLLLEGSTVGHNRVVAGTGVSQASVFSGADAGAMEVNGRLTVKNSKFVGNAVLATSPAGSIKTNGGTFASGGALFITSASPVTLADSLVSGNSARAKTSSGTATIQGGGIANCSSTLTLTRTTVTKNTGTATGLSGVAQGGGIWNVDACGGPVQPAHLTLNHSTVTQNSLVGDAGITLAGGGLFTQSPVTLTKSTITHNSPDQCSGC